MSRIIVYILTLLFVSSCSIKSKQICYYDFNGNTKDGSKNHWNLVELSKDHFTTDKNGKDNSAIKIDKEPLKLKGDSTKYTLPISFAFWVNFDELNPSMLGLGVSENRQTGIWFSLGKAHNTMNRLGINIGNGGRPSPHSRKTLVGTTQFKTNQWYHIVATIDENQNMQLFIDGNLEEGFYTGNASSFKFGSQHNYLGKVWKTNDMFKGSIDNFSIYSVVLTEKQIQKII